ncbi:hypothetical protein [Synechococcus sp. NOUM97013]|uniref:hypothetical protein n=1 Tax=Synechococcus sp. NOUM97013 TaxID=1442555 RepID=UPI001644C8B1|nr:hypothetical protein [Synechococcus sp. NOUM97013]QNI73406.1 putative conserved secreted protein [Synechococcus sp. NOUM97013]
MRSRLFCSALALTAGLIASPAMAQSASDASNSATKVLASTGSGFNVSAVEALIERGDAAVAAGNLAQAKKDYDNARTASKQLLAFYRDLSGAFRGLDARIPREMDTKGREALALLAQSNLRLAALFRRQGQPEIAVPVLVEVVRLMTPAKPEGQKAYQSLIELGFVETPYRGASAQP